MAAKLKVHGWHYIVVDIQWYEPGAKSRDYRKDAVLVMDDYQQRCRFPEAGRAGLRLKSGCSCLGGRFWTTRPAIYVG
jgi:hypothetical protein